MPPKKKRGGGGGGGVGPTKSIDELWEAAKVDPYNPVDGWYGKSKTYWAEVPATVNGVLNGKNPSNMAMWHDADIAESRVFIESLPHMGRKRALDCGAGMGRVTRDLLAPLYERCDLVEGQEHMLAQAQAELEGKTEGNFMHAAMEEVQLNKAYYDIILIQLAAMYLTDDDLVSLLKRCKAALTKRGFIFMKENCAKDHHDIDPADNGLMRTDAHFRALFAQAQLTCIREGAQKHWPSDVATLKMFALQ